MKKIFYILTSCTILFTSCAKNFDPNEESNLNPKTIEFSITANAPEYEAFETKGSLGAVTRVYWETNDKVAVYSVNGESSLTYLGVLAATTVSTSKATATFKGTLTLPSTTPSKLTFVYPASANLLDSDGNVVTNLEPGSSEGVSISYDLSHQTITSNGRVEFCANANSDYSSETVSLSSLNFYLASSFMSVLVTDANLADNSISDVALSDINSEVVLKPSKESESSSNYILQPSTSTNSTSSIHVTYETSVTITKDGKSMVSFAVPATASPASRKIRINGQYSTSFSTKQYEYGQYYLYPVSSFTSELFGPFTVADGKKVYFAPANLYFDGRDYHFESSQTDHTTSWNTSHVGLFYWSQNASVSYAEIYSDSKSIYDKFWCGEDNKLKVDGISGWYALTGGTDGEWYYLINSRTSASSLYKYGVTVTNNGTSYTNCLIIAPDGYTGTLQASYTLAELNEAGIVCLPAAGYRYGSNFWDSGVSGYYWTSTLYREENPNELLFGSGGVNTTTLDDRDYGNTLRLVRTITE